MGEVDPMTYDDSIRILQRLKSGYSKHLTDDAFNTWLDELEPLDFSPAYAAACTLIRTSKYFPAISEFLAAYATHERDQRPHQPPTACRHCDNGFQLTDDAANTVIPCPHCRPDLHQTWARGEAPKTEHQPTTALFTPNTATAERPDPTWADHARTVILEMQHVLDQARRNRGAT